MATLPYNPTTAVNPTNSTFVYVLRPRADTSNFELVSLDTTKSVSTSDASFSAASGDLPFSIDDTTALAVVSDSRGVIYALIGKCGHGAKDTELWTFEPKNDDGNGTWTQEQLSTDSVINPSVNGGTGFLAAGLAYSATSATDPDIYVFGGMCPKSSDLTAEDWQQSSSYSNALLAFQKNSTAGYSVSTPINRGSPIAEAGSSLTPLQPSFFGQPSNGNDQQQNFVLLGGQTDKAFTNMSQVALLSLPEESWTFIPIQSPSGAQTGLVRRSASNVDSRSGHSAVLADDGRSVVVTGGWVGDTNTPADPQIAILKLGSGYGGSGSWQWSVPDLQGSGLPPSSGIYGHGTVLLPGNVLMITGGYSISPTSSRKAKRASPVSSSTYFFNVTSNSWIDTYTNPSPRSAGSGADSVPLSLPSNVGNAKQQIGLGAGLGIGLAALLGILIFFLWYRRGLRRKRKARVLDPHAIVASRGLHSADSNDEDYEDSPVHGEGHAMQERHQDGTNPYPWAPAAGNDGAFVQNISRDGAPHAGAEAERTGLLIEAPSPTRGLRRSLYSRPSSYHYEDGRRSRGSGHIHPIHEADEDEAAVAASESTPYATSGDESPDRPRTSGTGVDIVTSAPPLDPFRDPTDRHLLDGSRSPSPPSPAARAREREVQAWVRDWTTAADSLMGQRSLPATAALASGRLSPDRSDRTSSTLSEHSMHSARSGQSRRSADGVSRRASQRSANLLAAVATEPGPLQRIRGVHRRSQSLTLGAEQAATHVTGNAAMAAAASGGFARLQAEGRALLGGGPSDPPGPSRARGWMGTLRRALTGGASRSAGAATSASQPSPTDPQFSAPGPAGWPMVQRSASAGAMVWRRRQGARDWDAGEDRRRSVGPAGDAPALPDEQPRTGNGREEDEGDWDVESAVERRVVQVMFTVPREKLRVVNAGPEADDDDGGQENPGVGSSRRRDGGDPDDGDGPTMGKGKGKERAE